MKDKSEHTMEPLLHCAQSEKDSPLWRSICLTILAMKVHVSVIQGIYQKDAPNQ
jgi:hypothetical protein